jgi:hypothetical protein
MLNTKEPFLPLCADRIDDLSDLFKKYGLNLHLVDSKKKIPGSFWQEPEAGLIGNTLYIRNDTPIHSAFHEACHYICMDSERRMQLDTNAGGDHAEENAVCYLQIILAQYLPDYSSRQMQNDMDQWGYTFRLGSTQAWFEKDAADACHWLIRTGIILPSNLPTWKIRHQGLLP